VLGKAVPNYGLTITSAYRNDTWYIVNGSSEKIKFSGDSGSIDINNWTSLDNGTLTLKFWINNTAGVINSDEIIVKRDITDPVISITTPSKSQEFENFPSFELDIDEPHIKEIWYTIDGGQNNWTCSATDDISEFCWTNADLGNVTLTFYVNDTAGNIGFAEINVTKLAETVLYYPGNGGGGGGGGKDSAGIPLDITLILPIIIIITIITTIIIVIILINKKSKKNKKQFT
jgi:hypothetical protein